MDARNSKSTEMEPVDDADRLRAILNAAVDAIITIDGQGIITGVNAATERMFGYAPDELIGQNVKMLMPSPYREEHDGYIANYLRTGQAKIIGIGREVLAQRKDGSVFPADLSVSRVDDHDMFTGMIRDASQRKALERALAESREHERRAIAQDLHDGVGAHLTGVGMVAKALHNALAREGSPHAEHAGDVVRQVRQVHEDVRRVSRGLAPVELGEGGLVAALSGLAENAHQPEGPACAFEWDGATEPTDLHVATQLYRIAQEAVTNAIRHAQPTRITIELCNGENGLTLRIADDGDGFGGSPDTEGGMGLRTMKHRADLIGAPLRVASAPGEGTVVTCLLKQPT